MPLSDCFLYVSLFFSFYKAMQENNEKEREDRLKKDRETKEKLKETETKKDLGKCFSLFSLCFFFCQTPPLKKAPNTWKKQGLIVTLVSLWGLVSLGLLQDTKENETRQNQNKEGLGWRGAL